MRSKPILLMLGLLVLAGCQTAPRRTAPPDLIGAATPVGFPPSVRLVTTDLRTFTALAPDFFKSNLIAASGRAEERVEDRGRSAAALLLLQDVAARYRPTLTIIDPVAAELWCASPSWCGDLTLIKPGTERHRRVGPSPS